MAYDLLKTSKALGDETRLSIYRYLGQSQTSPPSVQRMAKHFKLHPSAIRQHLGKLEEAGLVTSESERQIGLGRPQRVYKPKGPIRGMEFLPRNYKLLSEMLLEFITSSKVSTEEIKAFGRQWGENRVKDQKKDSTPRSFQEISRIMANQFSDWGFEPKLVSVSEQQIDIRLQNCVFREVVDFHPDIVCPLLHGVLEGMLAPFIGHRNTTLENGIAHGKETCEVLVSLKSS